MSGTTRMFLPRALLYGAAGAALGALLIGIPTDVIPNPVFGRPSTPVRPQDYAFLAISALLTGLLAASYAFPQTRVCATPQGRVTAGGVLSFLAIGCPTCNKVVVLAIGASGALNWFQPIQPLLGAVGVALLLVAVWARWRLILPGSSRGGGPLVMTPTQRDG